jgi:flagellar hook-length control protein FliK
MIDISQLVGNAGLKTPTSGTAGDARASAEANAFKDALTRARESGQPAVRVPAKPSGNKADARDTAAKDKSAEPSTQNKGDTQTAQANTRPAKDADGKTTGKADAATDTTQDAENGEDSTVASDAAAAAAALAAAMLLQPLPQQPAPTDKTAADPTGLNSLAGLNGMNGVNGLNGLNGPATLTGQAAAQAAAQAAQAAQAAAAAGDAAAPAQTDPLAQLPATATADATAKASTPSPADTLATIAQQRAALQGTAPTTADKIAAATQQVPVAGAQDAHGQSGSHTGGQSGSQQSSLGQTAQPALQAAPAPNANAPAANPFAAAAAAARTGESADTGATNASSAATLASAIAAQAAVHATPAAAAAAAARPAVAPNVGDSQWAQALGQQMVRLSTQGNQTAELDLNPPNLGPLKVVLNVVNDQAQAQFVSPHQAVRAAVEAALPHLRTSMAEAGIQLGQASVGSDGFAQAGNGGQQQPQRQSNGGSAFAQTTGFGKDTAPAVAATPAPRTPRPLARGEVDTFA